MFGGVKNPLHLKITPLHDTDRLSTLRIYDCLSWIWSLNFCSMEEDPPASSSLSASHSISVSNAVAAGTNKATTASSGEKGDNSNATEWTTKTHKKEFEPVKSITELLKTIDDLQADASKFLTECITSTTH